MEKDRRTSEQIDFELGPPNISGAIFIPNEEGEWEERKLPKSKEEAIEVEVEDGVFVDVYGGGKKFQFRARYKESGQEKWRGWYDSSFSPFERINATDKEAPFFWQVAKEVGLSGRYPPSYLWSKGRKPGQDY